MQLSIKYWISLLLLLLAFILIAVITFNLWFFTSERVKQQAITNALQVATQITTQIEHGEFFSDLSNSRLERVFSQQFLSNLVSAKIYDDKDMEIYSTYYNSFLHHHHETSKETINWVRTNMHEYHQYDDENNDIVVTIPLMLPKKKNEVYSTRVGLLHLVFDISKIKQEMDHFFLKQVLFNALLVLLIIVGFIFLLHFTLTKRLLAIIQAVNRITKGDYRHKILPQGNDEIYSVMQGINTMAEKIDNNEKELKEKVKSALDENIQKQHILTQQSKQASMGEMISNIAHQWRQPLNVLSLLLQKINLLALQDKIDEQLISQSVKHSQLQIEKMSQTIDDFRDFFKPDRQSIYFNVYDMCEELVRILEGALKSYNINLSIDADENLQIRSFKNELMQVLINILSNAKDALIINNIENGYILLEAKQSKNELHIKVKDNAGGIANNIKNRIFEPYFTTKTTGQGTGIGLYMSKTIIEGKLQGSLEAKNVTDGALFIIKLPIADKSSMLSHS